jgi:SAM-dependent methyltransferase
MSESNTFPATSMPDHNWWSALWPEPEGVLRQIGIEPGMTVLDLCCGDGYFTAPLAKLVCGKVHALDLDPVMIDQAKAEVTRQGTSVLQWICADARDITKLLPEPVDYILMANTFHGVPDQAGLARSASAVLRPQGLLAIVNWHRLPREETTVLGQPRGPRTELRMSPVAVAAVVEPAGFRMTETVDLPPYHYGIVFAAS